MVVTMSIRPIIHEISYNSQRDNYNFSGKFSAWSQCFSTCSWMFMSYYSSLYDGSDDKGLRYYVDNVEATVGKKGIGEKVRKKFSWIAGRTSLWWLTQKDGIEHYLWTSGVKGQVVFVEDRKKSLDHLKLKVQNGPVILGTKKIGGLPGGHIILLVGVSEKGFYVNDPFGNATKNYKDHDGDTILYPFEYIEKYLGNVLRYIYWV